MKEILNILFIPSVIILAIYTGYYIVNKKEINKIVEEEKRKNSKKYRVRKRIPKSYTTICKIPRY
jgi:uncharacterized protein YneF (UPF0154 family)